VIVTGCLGARDGGDFIRASHPRVLAVTGPHATAEVMAAVHVHLPKPHDPFIDLVPKQGIKLTPRHYAYLKISEGCNHRCTFCIIPSMRGDLVSRPIGEVLAEAERLLHAGVRELLVISQDTSAYGVDVRYRTGFWQGRPVKTRMMELATALDALAREHGAWVRLHYVYPYPQVDDAISLMTDDPARGGLLPYLDVPFQHASPRILKLMKRPANAEGTLRRIEAWRAARPDLTVRSTFIVGFPGETEREFEDLLAFLEAAQLDRVGCFAYSPVAGAAANALPDAVPDDVKEDRRARFMAVQAKISAARLARRVGKTMTVLVDGHDGTTALARSTADAPEIDGTVRIADGIRIRAGTFARVTITGAREHDLDAVAAP
jgi:ribosomal protein S12 methylthiotransferase